MNEIQRLLMDFFQELSEVQDYDYSSHMERMEAERQVLQEYEDKLDFYARKLVAAHEYVNKLGKPF